MLDRTFDFVNLIQDAFFSILDQASKEIKRARFFSGDVAMKREKLELVSGSGSVFRDLGHKNADADQFKAILAAEIIKALTGRA